MVAALVGCAALAVGLTVAVTGRAPSREGEPALTSPTVATTIIAFTSRPPPLTLADIARYGSAFEIRGEPEQEDESWEVADPERSIVLQRGPAGWYALFTDSSVLLDPPVPGTALPLATAEAAPSATDALDAARAVLTSAGALTGTWDARVGRRADAGRVPPAPDPLRVRRDPAGHAPGRVHAHDRGSPDDRRMGGARRPELADPRRRRTRRDRRRHRPSRSAMIAGGRLR
jgi:hypothetical protein